jgi:uncharacterized protein (DUF2252 family)
VQPAERRPRTGRAGKSDQHTPAERAAVGKAAQLLVPHEQMADWRAPLNRLDPVAVLEKQGETRVPELVPIRYGRMSMSAFAFYRGAAAVMAADLAAMPDSGLRVQLCGDAHLVNFGGFGSPERNLVFDLNDFDETLPGPWEWDVKRLVASFAVAGRERGFSTKKRHAVLAEVAGEYRRTMAQFAGWTDLSVWYAKLGQQAVAEAWGSQVNKQRRKKFKKTIAKANTKDSTRALSKLTRMVDGEPRIISQPPLIVPIDEVFNGALFEELIKGVLHSYRQTLPDDRRHLLDGYRYVDGARKVVGVGSVGTRTWIALLLGRDNDDPLFLQLKEAEESVLAPYAGASVYHNHGRRVVEGQKLVQAASDIFLGWNRVAGVDGRTHDYYMRQLWDRKGSADVDGMDPPALAVYGKMCGWTLARAHARTGDRIAINGYLGDDDHFDHAMAEFAEAYADQNEQDHKALLDATATGRITAETGF